MMDGTAAADVCTPSTESTTVKPKDGDIEVTIGAAANERRSSSSSRKDDDNEHDDNEHDANDESQQQHRASVVSFQSVQSSPESDLYTHKEYDTPCNVCSWPRMRYLLALSGCCSSILVCTVRLILDPGSTTYTIHSIVILLDMALIHIFTSTIWLSVSGELVTVGSLLLFHWTKETVFELLETTLIAALCSLHMISSRSEHWDREEALEGALVLVVHSRRISERSSMTIDDNDSDGDDECNTETERLADAETERLADAETERLANADEQDASTANDRHYLPTTTLPRTREFTASEKDRRFKTCVLSCSRHFFEHFLDGSAGVMYTSFAGLILDEFILWGIRGGQEKED